YDAAKQANPNNIVLLGGLMLQKCAKSDVNGACIQGAGGVPGVEFFQSIINWENTYQRRVFDAVGFHAYATMVDMFTRRKNESNKDLPQLDAQLFNPQ